MKFWNAGNIFHVTVAFLDPLLTLHDMTAGGILISYSFFASITKQALVKQNAISFLSLKRWTAWLIYFNFRKGCHFALVILRFSSMV